MKSVLVSLAILIAACAAQTMPSLSGAFTVALADTPEHVSGHIAWDPTNLRMAVEFDTTASNITTIIDFNAVCST